MLHLSVVELVEADVDINKAMVAEESLSETRFSTLFSILSLRISRFVVQFLLPCFYENDSMITIKRGQTNGLF